MQSKVANRGREKPQKGIALQKRQDSKAKAASKKATNKMVAERCTMLSRYPEAAGLSSHWQCAASDCKKGEPARPIYLINSHVLVPRFS